MDPLLSVREVVKFLASAPVVGGYIAAVIGAVAMHLWTRYRERMVGVRYLVNGYPLGVASQHESLGNIGVTFNDTKVDNVHLINIDVENESATKDLAHLPLTFRTVNHSWLVGQGVHDSSMFIPWSQRYATLKQHADELSAKKEEMSAELRDVLFKRREFVLPVLNRLSRIRFSFAAISWEGNPPVVVVDCEHLGVRLRRSPAAELFLGVNKVRAAMWGLLMGLVLTAVAAFTIENRLGGSVLAFLLGAGGQFIGAGALRGLRGLRKVLS